MRVSRLPPLPTGLIVSQQYLFMSAKRGGRERGPAKRVRRTRLFEKLSTVSIPTVNGQNFRESLYNERKPGPLWPRLPVFGSPYLFRVFRGFRG